MPFLFEKLDVYQRGVDFADEIATRTEPSQNEQAVTYPLHV